MLKQFLTANKIYGADAKTEGFSGYICELLIIRYGGFKELMKSACNWRPGEIIDIENRWKKEEHPQATARFKNNPLVLIDPTDKNRNTGSPISIENFLRFKKLAKKFLQKPSAKYFSSEDAKPVTKNELRKLQSGRKTEMLLVKFNPPKVVPDILWPQMRRFGERLQNILEETKYEFKVLRRDVYSNEKDSAMILLEMEVSELPHVQKRTGPSVFDANDSARFLEKYKNPLNGPFTESVNWVVEVNRRFLTAHEKLVDSLKKNAEILKAKGIPNYIAEQLAKGFDIIHDEKKLMQLIEKDKNFGVFLRNYYKKESLV